MPTDIQQVRISYTNDFLLKCRNGYLLIDTGFPGEYTTFMQKIAKIHIAPSEIKYLLLTHYHDDHAGFASELLKNTHARLIVHKNAVSFLEKGKVEYSPRTGRFLNKRLGIMMNLFSKLSARSYIYPPVKIKEGDYIVDDNPSGILNKIGVDGRIFYTPGHSEDSISVVLSDGSAFVSDLAMNAFYFKILGNHYLPVWIQDQQAVKESQEKILNAGAQTIYPAHGNAFAAKKFQCL